MTEQNRTTLKDALSRMPVYAPPAKCWQEIGRELDKDAREDTLHAALNELPDYAPPSQNWARIAETLEADAAEQRLKDALSKLPQYAPPAETWTAIEQEIRPPARRIKLMVVARAAAAIALLVGLWWAWPQQEAAPLRATYSYDQQTTNAQFASIEDWGQADALMQKAVDEFREDPVAKQLPAYELLLSEWADLKGAQEEVAKMMERYGKDTQLIRQMSEIEKERSSLIREMIAQI
ncbi:hypothetical protein [Phaeodactylibacter sp.]|uniref:hypothetical protein n=1 Tax=Phaeodactylibacter sp. TaxID=1940289 RepID=UPI0025D1850A|nr:hypothetical protein [Phaeodactylibacter sp.]MCI4651736.1 hypothetical protein [Phaeodactylibacter sp.]MCI5091668.1 hypothetical protein [Phaeodactylibacter sp.]